MSWDYDGGTVTDGAGSYNFLANELTGQSSGLPDRLLFTLNSGQRVQPKLEGDVTAGEPANDFAGAIGDVLDFAPGVAKTLIAGTNSVAANDIVVQYYWKTADAGGTFTGGSLGDKLVGGTGTDIFNGAAGNDTITGGAGSDQITLGDGVDNLVLNSLVGSDTILDFVVADDRIQLAKSVFTALGATGALTADQFVSGAGVVAGADATDRIAYDTTTGQLFYDSDGNGAAAPVLLATFTGAPVPLLTVANFTVI